MSRIRRVVIHHSASPRTTSPDAIRNWHETKGWRAVGYHYLIDHRGKTHVGRPLPEMGAHAKGANRDSIGICVIGNNAELGQEWNTLQRHALIELCKALLGVFPGLTFHAHKDVGSTKTRCPGCDIGLHTGLPVVLAA